jgi:outer membrane beta-barrel protein
LGSSREVAQRVAQLDARSRVAIVQNRAVKREWRFEVGTSFGPVASGDSYLRTSNAGVQADLHVSPKFSLGVRYAKAFNELTPEGKQQFEDAQRAKRNGALDYRIPDLDYPEESILGVANWYMMYGKINVFDISIVQFDIYSLAGAGQMKLASGMTDTWTAGGGIGFWLSQHVTSRFEVRYQTYSDQVYTGPRKLDLIVAQFGLGVLL